MKSFIRVIYGTKTISRFCLKTRLFRSMTKVPILSSSKTFQMIGLSIVSSVLAVNLFVNKNWALFFSWVGFTYRYVYTISGVYTSIFTHLSHGRLSVYICVQMKIYGGYSNTKIRENACIVAGIGNKKVCMYMNRFV